MILRLLIVFVVCISCSGCIALLKEQTPGYQSDVCIAPPERKSDMVWVEAKTSKIWVGPQLDDNGDMIEGHYKYTVITPGHWGGAKDNQP